MYCRNLAVAVVLAALSVNIRQVVLTVRRFRGITTECEPRGKHSKAYARRDDTPRWTVSASTEDYEAKLEIFTAG